MNNREFISALAYKMGMNVGDTQKMMNDTIDEMVNQFDEGNELFFHGFGTFEVKKRNERVIVNPTTMKRMLVPPRLTLNFRWSETLKNKVK